jgi:bile-acid 7alpha-dehydratase
MRCVDQKRWQELAGCLSPDASCSYGDGKFSFRGREAVMKFLVDAMDRPSFLSSHRVHQPEIQLTSATTATGVWALEDYVIDLEHDLRLHGAAFYRDAYVKQAGEWKIQHTGYERTFEEIETGASRRLKLTRSAWGGAGPA